MNFLILTQVQADTVRGEASPGYVLAPIELADGSYCLPARVLDEPGYAAHFELLAALPRVETVMPKPVEEE